MRWLISLISFSATSSGVNIMVPLYALQLGGSIADLGPLTAVFYMTYVPSVILWGEAADRFTRRRRLYILSIVMGAVLLLLFPFVKSVTDLIILRAVLGFLHGGPSMVVIRMLVGRESKDKWGKRIGSISAYQGIGSILGLALWSIILTITDSRTLLIFMALSSFIALFLALLLTPRFYDGPEKEIHEASRAPASRVTLKSFLDFVDTRHLSREQLTHNFIFFIHWLGVSLLIVLLPAFLRDMLIPDNIVYILLYLGNPISTFFFSISGRLMERIGEKKLMLISSMSRTSLMMVYLLFAIFLPQVREISLAMKVGVFSSLKAAWSTAYALLWIPGNILALKMAKVHRVGEAQGFFSASVNLSEIIGPIMGSLIASSFGYPPVFLMGFSFMMLSTLMIIFFMPETASEFSLRRTNTISQSRDS